MIAARLLLFLTMAVVATASHADTFEELLGDDRVTALVKEETSGFVDQFRAMTTQSTIEVDDSFYPAVIEPILATETSEQGEAAERSLRIGFGSFLSDITAFLLATDSIASLSAEAVSRYFDVAQKVGRCGRVPCKIGCPDGCDEMCNPCVRQRVYY